MRCDWGDVMKIVLATAPLDETAATSLRIATETLSSGPPCGRGSARRFRSAKAGHDASTTPTDMLWFYFGYSGFFTLMEDNGWSADRAEEWLREMAAIAVLGSHDG